MSKLTRVLTAARAMLGVPYLWGGESPHGFDCSGLVQWAYAKAGVRIPRTTYEQIKVGQHVPWGHFRPGDIIFAEGGHHEVMYVGNGKVIAAPHTGAVVRIQSVNDFKGSFVGARRIVRGGGIPAGSFSTPMPQPMQSGGGAGNALAILSSLQPVGVKAAQLQLNSPSSVLAGLNPKPPVAAPLPDLLHSPLAAQGASAGRSLESLRHQLLAL